MRRLSRDPEMRRIQVEAAKPAAPTRPFALLVGLPSTEKPSAFDTLEALAARIHTLRRGSALSLRDAKLSFKGRPGPSRAVAVYTQDEAGNPTGFLGFAWIGEKPWTVLQAALYALEPNTAERAEAA